MVKKRILAVPFATVFIVQLPEATQNIIKADFEQYAREKGIRLEWDWEANTYTGLTRRFCDMDDIYEETDLEFCEPGEDIEPYENSQQRKILLRLTDNDAEALCKRAGEVELTVSQLLENFIADLINGSKINGSDERMYANQWFERCWFSHEPDDSFLTYLLAQDMVDYVKEKWELLQEFKHQEYTDEYEREEMEWLIEDIEDTFQAYREETGEPSDTDLDEAMGKVLEWDREKQKLLEGDIEKSKVGERRGMIEGHGIRA